MFRTIFVNKALYQPLPDWILVVVVVVAAAPSSQVYLFNVFNCALEQIVVSI